MITGKQPKEETKHHIPSYINLDGDIFLAMKKYLYTWDTM